MHRHSRNTKALIDPFDTGAPPPKYPVAIYLEFWGPLQSLVARYDDHGVRLLIEAWFAGRVAEDAVVTDSTSRAKIMQVALLEQHLRGWIAIDEKS